MQFPYSPYTSDDEPPGELFGMPGVVKEEDGGRQEQVAQDEEVVNGKLLF